MSRGGGGGKLHTMEKFLLLLVNLDTHNSSYYN